MKFIVTRHGDKNYLEHKMKSLEDVFMETTNPSAKKLRELVENIDLCLEDYKAIVEAVNGFSTKSKERGFGLSSSSKILIEGFDGEFLIVSGKGVIHLKKKVQNIYNLQEKDNLEGTLLVMKLPLPSKKVDLYDYLS